jgi:hypothetical protein
LTRGELAIALRIIGKGSPKRKKSKETMQAASYARWPLAASAVNTTNHHLIIFDITDKDKNLCNIVEPRATIRTDWGW